MLPSADEFLDAGQAALLHQLDAHDGVFVEISPRILAVGADSADDRRQMNHDLRLNGLDQSPHVRLQPQIVFAAARCDDRCRIHAIQGPAQRTPQEAGAAGYKNSSIFEETHLYCLERFSRIEVSSVAMPTGAVCGRRRRHRQSMPASSANLRVICRRSKRLSANRRARSSHGVERRCDAWHTNRSHRPGPAASSGGTTRPTCASSVSSANSLSAGATARSGVPEASTPYNLLGIRKL